MIKLLNSKENSKSEVPNQTVNQKLKHTKRVDNNYHIPDVVQALSYLANGGLKLVL